MGLALVDELMRRGARVAFVARTRERVDEVARAHPHAYGIVGDVAKKDDIYPIALQIMGALGGLDVLVNNASSLGPVPLALLADTECEDLELALATNVLGPFRLTKALLGALAASAREGLGAVVVNISSDAAINAYPQWGAYGASKAALRHMTRIWDEELAPQGIHFLSLDPGDMDTPLHALAVPDADPSTLKRPEAAAREIADAIARPPSRRCMRVGETSGHRRSDAVIAAHTPVQRPRDAGCLIVDATGSIGTAARDAFVGLLNPHDLVIANDAATLPASLHGRHAPSGAVVEVRLAARASLHAADVHRFVAVVFGAGDFRTRTEDRPLPPQLAPGDRLELGPLSATVESLLDHPRLVSLAFRWRRARHLGRSRDGTAGRFNTPTCRRRSRYGMCGRRLPQCRSRSSHRRRASCWTGRRSARCIGAASRLPRSRLPPASRQPATWSWIAGCRSTSRIAFPPAPRQPSTTRGGRAVASSPSAPPSCARSSTRPRATAPCIQARPSRISVSGRRVELRVVDAILSGTHEPDSSHYQLLRAFADDATLAEATAALEASGYRTHEFGDSVLIERVNRVVRQVAA